MEHFKFTFFFLCFMFQKMEKAETADGPGFRPVATGGAKNPRPGPTRAPVVPWSLPGVPELCALAPDKCARGVVPFPFPPFPKSRYK